MELRKNIITMLLGLILSNCSRSQLKYTEAEVISFDMSKYKDKSLIIGRVRVSPYSFTPSLKIGAGDSFLGSEKLNLISVRDGEYLILHPLREKKSKITNIYFNELVECNRLVELNTLEPLNLELEFKKNQIIYIGTIHFSIKNPIMKYGKKEGAFEKLKNKLFVSDTTKVGYKVSVSNDSNTIEKEFNGNYYEFDNVKINTKVLELRKGLNDSLMFRESKHVCEDNYERPLLHMPKPNLPFE